METGAVDAGDGIARGKLARRNVGRGIHGELQRNWQLAQIDLVTLQNDLVPGRGIHHFARDIFLAALAECRRQVGYLDAQACRQQLAVAGHIGDQRHGLALHLLENYDRAPPRPVELEQHGGGLVLRVHFLPDPQEVVGIVGLDHAQKSTQALVVDIRGSCHDVSNAPMPPEFIIATDCNHPGEASQYCACQLSSNSPSGERPFQPPPSLRVFELGTVQI